MCGAVRAFKLASDLLKRAYEQAYLYFFLQKRNNYFLLKTANYPFSWVTLWKIIVIILLPHDALVNYSFITQLTQPTKLTMRVEGMKTF